MSFTFKPATRENVGLLIGLAGGTGSGKTFSAMELAAGLSGGKPFCVIDTEARRALHYADRWKFDHGELRPPFRPQAYEDAIKAADEAGYPVIVVDSASHEHAGEGGLLDWHDEQVATVVEKRRAFAAQKGWEFNESAEEDKAKVSGWIEPKMAHKRFVQRLLQLRAHLILCFRAEEKIEIVKVDQDGNVVDKGGKTVVRPKETATGLHGWVPIAEKSLPYELTCSFLLLADAPGVGLPIKLQEQHRRFFPSGKVIGRAAGEALAEWARGSGAAAPAAPEPPQDALPSRALDDALTAIAAARSAGELEVVGKGLKAAKLEGAERQRALAAYRTRQEALKTGQAEATHG